MKIESEKEKKLDTALNKLITLDLNTNLKISTITLNMNETAWHACSVMSNSL